MSSPRYTPRSCGLRHAGIDAAGVAAELRIDIDAVGPLLRVAEAKLTQLLMDPDPSEDGGTRHVGRVPDPSQRPGG
jgi:hypothetical protein